MLLHYLEGEERDKYPFDLPDILVTELIERSYNELIDFVARKKSRLAYQVLGVLLMKYGGKITENVKTLILKYYKWEDEKDQLTNKNDINERKNYLFDFREKVKNYKDGVKAIVPIELLTEIMDQNKDNSFIDRVSLDYKIIS